MAHLHTINENIDLPFVPIIEEKQPLMPVKRIKSFMTCVPEVWE